MCHGQVIGQSVLSVPAKCQKCGAGPGTVYRLTWRANGEVCVLLLCPTCTAIEIQRPK